MKLFEQGELKLLWPFYLEYFLASLLFFAPAFWLIYFLNIGFNLLQVSIIVAASQIAVLIFEIPTGAFADLYGRKFSVLLGYFLEGVCMISLFFFRGYSFVVIIFWFSVLLIIYHLFSDIKKTSFRRFEMHSILNPFRK